MELKQDEIIKALQCFHSRILNSNLAEKITEGEIMSIINALSLIKELTEENERLLTALAKYDQQTEVRIAEEYYTAEAYEELREENERLKNICESYMLQYGTVVDKNVLIKPLGIDLKGKI